VAWSALAVAPWACDADSGPATELASARSAPEAGVVTHRVRGVATETATSATSKPVEGRVLDLESSREVSVPMGQVFKVELVANSGTGFEWSCAASADCVLRQAGAPMVRPIDRGVMGGRVLWVFSFEPQRTGNCAITFNLARPWEAGTPAAKTTTLTVSVTPAGQAEAPDESN
jgi:predicted secreted protein